MFYFNFLLDKKKRKGAKLFNKAKKSQVLEYAAMIAVVIIILYVILNILLISIPIVTSLVDITRTALISMSDTTLPTDSIFSNNIVMWFILLTFPITVYLFMQFMYGFRGYDNFGAF